MKVGHSKQKRPAAVSFVDFLLLGIVLFLLDDDTLDWLDDLFFFLFVFVFLFLRFVESPGCSS
jgi:hypothetical protein